MHTQVATSEHWLFEVQQMKPHDAQTEKTK